jgi:hypothetical protein
MLYHKGKRDELTVKKGWEQKQHLFTEKIEFAKIEKRICANKIDNLCK